MSKTHETRKDHRPRLSAYERMLLSAAPYMDAANKARRHAIREPAESVYLWDCYGAAHEAPADPDENE